MSTTHIIPSRFPLGQVVATSALISALEENGLDAEDAIMGMLACHASGDWGALDKFDKLANDAAVLSGHDRILSRYDVGEISVYVITEWDRSHTTIMRVEDY